MTPLRAFIQQEDGATAIEYGLIAALIFIVILAAVSAVSSETTNLFNTIASHVSTSTAP